MDEKISVIIPTRNAESQIGNLLSTIKSQSIPCEIIIIDSSSTDKTVAVSESYGARVIPIKKEDFNHGGTRNVAAFKSNGDIIVFMTQDTLPVDKNCIENLTKPLGQDNIAASYGRQIAYDNAKPTEKFARNFNYPETAAIKSAESIEHSGIKTFFFSNAFSAIRKPEFKVLGGFPEDVLMFEDMLFAAKLVFKGFSIAYVPDAKVIHSHDLSFSGQFERYFQAGVSFRKNSWFLEHAKSGSEGVRFLKEEIKYLLQHNAHHWAFYAVIEALFKYSGYKIGLNYDKIPFFIKKYLNE